ncbi:MAG: pilus assembly protein PilN [Clostridia bacterium]|jgi:type IV pilus assembly protein PilN|nr:pilus assembly protein PilN [Clostridia bacterium]
MKDFNFFSPYLLEKQNKNSKIWFIIAVSSVLTIGLITFTTFNIYYMNRYKSEISKVESYLNSKETMEQLEKYEEVSERLVLLNTYFDTVKEIDDKLDSYDTVSTELLDKLSSIMPQDASMTNLAISNKDVEINYSIKSLLQAAELEHNLKELNIFEQVHINIVDMQTNYTAIISCKLKDVNKSEAQTDK